MNSGKPLVSVLVPLYNHARFVETCLNSIYNDDYPAIEVFVLDDGSTDDSFSVAQRWREQHPGVFQSFEVLQQSNQGITRTLNRLISLAKGEYLALLASDDYLLEGGLEARVRALEENPQWLAVFADCVVVDDDGKLLYDSGLSGLYHQNKRALRTEAFIAEELVLRWQVPGPTFMARRVTYDSELGVGRYDELLAFEDRDFYLRLLAKKALGFVDTQVAAYRLHPTNTFKPQNLARLRTNFLTMYKSEVKYLPHFSGMAKKGLTLRAKLMLHVHDTLDRQTVKTVIIKRLMLLGLEGWYLLHTLRVWSHLVKLRFLSLSKKA